MITVEHNGSTYHFVRDVNGVGDWVCVDGRGEGLLGSVIHNVILPIALQQELSRKARANGISADDISRTVKVEEKKPKKAVSVGGNNRRSRSTKPRGIPLGGD